MTTKNSPSDNRSSPYERNMSPATPLSPPSSSSSVDLDRLSNLSGSALPDQHLVDWGPVTGLPSREHWKVVFFLLY